MGIWERDGKWCVQWRERGKIRSMTVGSKTTAKRILASKKEHETLRRAGLVSAQDETFAKAEGRSIAQHIEDFEKSLKAKKVTDKEIRQKVERLNKLRDYGSIRALSDFTEEKIQAAIEGMQEDGFRITHKDGKGPKRKYSLEALNKYLLAAKQFGRWCARTHRTKGNAVDGLSLFNAKTDRRHDRRVFTTDEIALLLNPAGLYQNRTRKSAINPEDRAMLYRVAMLTGFRASELRSLTPESFNLDAFTAEVQAAFSKRRRQDIQPLPVELVDKLRPWIASRPKGKRLWAVAKNMAKVLRRDLEALGIPYEVDGRFGDFHALRHTYITRLVEAGLNPKDAQTLARHSSITLTMDRYTHVDRDTLRGKLATVTPLPEPVSGAASAL